MDDSTLQKGLTLQSNIREHERVLEHLMKFRSGKDDPIDFANNYLMNCSNVGSSSIRKSLALNFIGDSIEYLKTRIKMDREEFVAL